MGIKQKTCKKRKLPNFAASLATTSQAQPEERPGASSQTTEDRSGPNREDRPGQSTEDQNTDDNTNTAENPSTDENTSTVVSIDLSNGEFKVTVDGQTRKARRVQLFGQWIGPDDVPKLQGDLKCIVY